MALRSRRVIGRCRHRPSHRIFTQIFCSLWKIAEHRSEHHLTAVREMVQLCGDCNVGHGDSTKDHLHYLVVDPRWRASFPGTVKRGSPFVAWQTRIRTTGSRWTCASTCDLRELCCSLWCLRCREPLIHLLLLVIEEKLSPFRARLLRDDAPHHPSSKTHLRRPRSKV